MEARSVSMSAAMEDARYITARDQPIDDALKIYGAYHSIRPFHCKCKSENLQPSSIIRQILPCINWIQRYKWSFLLADLIAGITVGLAIVPQSIAYAAIAGLPLQYGLYSSFMGPFIYALLGTSKDVSIGPTTVMALLVLEKISQYPTELAPTIAVLLTFYTGCVQLAMGILRLGFFVDFVSLSVAKAFIAAASLIIAVEQFKGLLGLKFSSGGFPDFVYEIFNNIKETNYWDLILGLSVMVVITLLKWVSPKPGFVRTMWYDKVNYHFLRLISNARYAIAICAAGAVEGALLSQRISAISLPTDIEPGLPPVEPPEFHIGNQTSWQSFKSLGSSLVVFPLISLLELALIAKAFAQEYRYNVNSTQEFRAVGLANLISSFFGSYPVTASFSRSALNAQCGVKTQAAGIVTGALALLATAFITPWLHYIPKAALAGVIICAVLPNVDLSVLNKMWKIRKGDLFPYIVTFCACILLGIEYGVLIGIFVSVALILFPIARPTVAIYRSGQDVIVTPYGNINFPAMGYLRVLAKMVLEAPTRYDSELMEGDIVGLETPVKTQGAANAVDDASSFWPNNTIPYQFSRKSLSVSDIQMIQESMNIISRLTGSCVKFVERSTESDFITFQKGLGCLSIIGRIGGRQTISLSNACLKHHGDVQHEIMHTLGFLHEQSRQDRDNYVIINWDNIAESERGQFEKYEAGNTYGLPYDYESIMHYKVNAFAKDPALPTILPKIRKTKMGQNENLSPLDVVRIHRRFGCAVPTAANFLGLEIVMPVPSSEPPTNALTELISSSTVTPAAKVPSNCIATDQLCTANGINGAYCCSGFCLVLPNQPNGTCKPPPGSCIPIGDPCSFDDSTRLCCEPRKCSQKGSGRVGICVKRYPWETSL